nr:maleylpyruvate isomerase N-terminal domain-containing protein [uncultured Actinoplanes sp.]
MDYRRAFRAAAVSFADLVSRVPGGRWDEAGLGEWTLRDLVGHAVSSGLGQVPAALATPAGEVAVESAAAYFGLARKVPAETYAAAVKASAEDARATGERLGDDPAATIGDLVGRATQALAATGDDAVVTTAGGGMRLRDWLPTRTFELVVHGMDVAAAAGVDAGFGPDVTAEATLLAARIAVEIGDGPVVLRALTGRGPLPGSFSVV